MLRLPGVRVAWVLGLVPLAVLSWWLMQHSQPPVPAPEQPRNVIDYYANDYVATVMDAAGQPRHRLRAETLRHFSVDETTELDKPHLTVFRDSQPPWQIRAERGWLGPDSEELFLGGAVTAQRSARPGFAPVTVETADMWVFPQRDYAETSRSATIYSHASVVRSEGMELYIAQGRLRLLNEARGWYGQP